MICDQPVLEAIVADQSAQLLKGNDLVTGFSNFFVAQKATMIVLSMAATGLFGGNQVSAMACWLDAMAGMAQGAQPGELVAAARGINLFQLLLSGGWFMVPLVTLSVLAVILVVERFLALRTERILPERLVQRLGRLGQAPGGLDPRDAYLICQGIPSVAANVLRSVLVKVGRPHMELEHACSEAAQRSAVKLQVPVSWLNVVAAIAPLIGLLGTVWGITQAFYDTTQLEVGQNRAEALSQGIYIALVTTIAGLTIAIPATVASHFFETRIVSLMNRIEEMVRGILPQLERFEGVVRFAPGGNEAEPGTVVEGNGPVLDARRQTPGSDAASGRKEPLDPDNLPVPVRHPPSRRPV